MATSPVTCAAPDRGALALVLILEHQPKILAPRRELAEELARAIRRAVVDHDQLEWSIDGRRADALHDLADRRDLIKTGMITETFMAAIVASAS